MHRSPLAHLLVAAVTLAASTASAQVPIPLPHPASAVAVNPITNQIWVLSEAEDHPDVEDVYRRALALDSKVSIATVYRTVRLLEENGILERRDFGGGRARYDPADRGHHHHLIDVDTGKVIEFADEEFEALARAMARRLGFDLVGQRLELFGRKVEAEPARPAGRSKARSS